METFTRFFYEFLSQFFSGLITIVKAIGTGIGQIFDINSYKSILEAYKNDLYTFSSPSGERSLGYLLTISSNTPAW